MYLEIYTGPVAQSGRALGLHPRGPGFKSPPVHQKLLVVYALAELYR
jgi:hypothetical protein